MPVRPGPHLDPVLEARERPRAASSPPSRLRFDLARAQRARSDEAHVAAEDVPQLRQLVHRRRAHEAADARSPADRARVAWTAPVAASASGRIDRNFSAVNGRPPSPTRSCVKKIGPPSSSLIAAANSAQSGAEQQQARRRRARHVERRASRRLRVERAQPLAQVRQREFVFDSRARLARRAARAARASSISRRNAARSAAASPAGTISPVRSCWLTHDTPLGTSVLITGLPLAIASSCT